MISSKTDLERFINDKNFKKIFILCGKKSFISSGAKIFFENIFVNKEFKIFLDKFFQKPQRISFHNSGGFLFASILVMSPLLLSFQ